MGAPARGAHGRRGARAAPEARRQRGGPAQALRGWRHQRARVPRQHRSDDRRDEHRQPLGLPGAHADAAAPPRATLAAPVVAGQARRPVLANLQLAPQLPVLRADVALVLAHLAQVESVRVSR